MGESGHIYAVPDGQYQIVVVRETSRHWTFAKDKLQEIGAQIQNDGDTEGSALITGLPSSAEAAIIRKLISVKRRRHLSDDQRERGARLAAHRLEAWSARPLQVQDGKVDVGCG